MSFPDYAEKTRHQLDPWRVIVACLFELDSHETPGIIDMSGMAIDWRLTEREDYSHKYRKAAYRPRINAAYEALNEDDKLRVAFIVCAELAQRGLAEQLNAGLQRICWRIDGGCLTPTTETVRELFFPQGTQHDAYVRIREIFSDATQSIRVIDPYMDGSIYTILGRVHGLLKVELLAANPPPDFVYETVKFQQQHRQVRIEARRSRDFHDRFIVTDEDECWHLGCSIKDAGNKAFMLSRIEDARNAKALLRTLRSTWVNAIPLR